MESLAAVVKAALVPGSTAFLVVAVGLGVLLLHVPRAQVWGRRWLVLVVIGYLLLGMPQVSRLLEGSLHPPYPGLRTADDARGATAIVVLGNGAVMYGEAGRALYGLTRRTSMNVLEGARLYRLLGRPQVILSGGTPGQRDGARPEADLMAEAMERLGVPRERMVLERTSVNTAQQAARVGPLLAGHRTVLLVTTPIHMARALELFASGGRVIVPAPSEVAYAEPELGPVERFVPNAGALRGSELVLYEYLAVVKNWLGEGRAHRRDVPE